MRVRQLVSKIEGDTSFFDAARFRILAINAGGVGDLHGRRVRYLTSHLQADVHLFEVDRSHSRWANAHRLWRVLKDDGPWDLAYLESSGIAGGVPLIYAAWSWGQRYIVSTGDPVSGYFRTVNGRLMGNVFAVYERQLYRNCAAFVGWTPYLTGRALALGAPRAMTAEGGVDLSRFRMPTPEDRAAARLRLDLPEEALVFGMIGRLTWSRRQQYCYGLELVEMIKLVERDDLFVLIVGDGEGRAELDRRLPEKLKDRVVFTGRVPADDIPKTVFAMDVGFVTQTLDGLGSYRLTTKLPEYLAAGVPVAMSPIPGYYDYVGAAAGWALSPRHPASSEFHRCCADWADALTRNDVERRREPARKLAEKHFDYNAIAERFAQFVGDLLSESARW